MISLRQAIARIAIAQDQPWAPLPWPQDDPWHAIFVGCESPIERLMCIGFYGYLGYGASADEYRGAKSLPSRRAGAVVFGQQVIDRYPVDFLVIGFIRGEEPIRIVVECDGKEFHDARRDEVHDRILGDLGFVVLRFTGSEVVRNLGQSIMRIPVAMGARYASMIAAEHEPRIMSDPEVVDYLDEYLKRQREREQASALPPDDRDSDWDDSI